MPTIACFTTVNRPEVIPPMRHYQGMPRELSGSVDTRVAFPWPRVLVIIPDNTTGGAFLYRLADDWTPAGDTWHFDVAEAKQAALEEYSACFEEWRNIPEDVDAIDYALAQAQTAR